MLNRTYLYIRKGTEHIYQKFREIANREDRSPSQILMELMEEYVRRHEVGNPQRLLASFAEGQGQISGPPPCLGVRKIHLEKVYCTKLGGDWIKLGGCWRCWRRRGGAPSRRR